jgi:response regulator NasT
MIGSVSSVCAMDEGTYRASARAPSGRRGRRDEPSIQPAPAAPARRGELHRVLVADDEYLVANELAAMLTDQGYAVIGPVADGDAALALCRRYHPDLAMLDIRMPCLNGLEAARTAFDELGIPAVIVSAYADPEYVAAAARTGVFGYLVKPVSPDQLRACLGVAWARFRSQAVDGSIATVRTVGAAPADESGEPALIERAARVVAQRRAMDEASARRLLKDRAERTGWPMVEVARAVLEAEALL